VSAVTNLRSSPTVPIEGEEEVELSLKFIRQVASPDSKVATPFVVA